MLLASPKAKLFYKKHCVISVGAPSGLVSRDSRLRYKNWSLVRLPRSYRRPLFPVTTLRS